MAGEKSVSSGGSVESMVGEGELVVLALLATVASAGMVGLEECLVELRFARC